jgi:FAD dependent oxidoreductase TIGR03364
MVWPIGQPPGELYRRALRSRERWLELARAAGVSAEPCGSLHVAHEDDEARVIEEFAGLAPGFGIACEHLTPAEAVRRFPAVNPDGLKAALYSPTELAVDPPAAVARLPHYLAEAHGVTLRFGAAVVGVDAPRLRTAAGEVWQADAIFVCSGSDFETLFPEVFAASGARRCKLQMMKTRPQPGGWRLGAHLAGGLTLCHYQSFGVCSTLPALKSRVTETMPEYVRYGIHVMASQNPAGEVVIGDSHEYEPAISPFDSTEIDHLILTYLRRFARLPDWDVSTRWHGVYARHRELPLYTAEPQPGCHVIAAAGGSGMTMAFGHAAAWWDAREPV